MNISKLRSTRLSRPHKGLALLEWIVYVGLGLGALAVLASYIGDSSSANDIQTETQNVITIASNSRDSWSSANGYGTTSLLSELTNRKGIPSSMTNNNGVVTNVWGGTVDSVGNGTYYTVSYAKVPQEACAKMTARLSKNSLFASTIINASSTTGEVTPAVASQKCQSGSNTISWVSSQ